MINSIIDWDKFERTVCSIVYKTNPYQLSRYDGGADRGRDIVAKYEKSGKLYNVIIECKYYQSGVGKSVITPALDWAKVHRPDLLYFWISPYLTSDTKDFIDQFERQYGVKVLYEEQINIEQYLRYYDKDDHEIWVTLRKKILDACELSNSMLSLFDTDTSVLTVEDIPYLIDREDERKTLINPSICAFYIQGISACGKTQLMKYISYIYTQEKNNVFWYTFRSENKEAQCDSFFQSLAHYFAITHNDTKLIIYFREYGYFLSRDLENLFIYLLRQYNPIVFLDDVHNCTYDNISLIGFFEKIIEQHVCRVYFAGWINIFSNKTIIKQNLSIVILDGLKAVYLNQIISHYSGHENLTIAGAIADRFHGLPGYAILVNEYTTIDDLESDRQFLHKFLAFLSPKEQVLLFGLVFSSFDIPIDFLLRNGYSLEFESLKDKRLIIIRESACSVHDKYKPFFVTYPIEEPVFRDTVNLMIEYAKISPEEYFDIITSYLDRKNLLQAWQILNQNFKELLHCQKNVKFLNILQRIESDNSFIINTSNIIFMKITLLERVGEYQLCLYYITLLDFDLFSLEEQEALLYIQMRALYFTNKYDELLALFQKQENNIDEFLSQEIATQILTIVGRVYYIRGLLEGALACYLLSYQYAFKNNEKKLEAKIIHRIAMVECCYGHISESRLAFESLEKTQNIITPKRRSYIYYRIAKCLLLENKSEEAKGVNQKSIKIKESYNDKRGLIFSNKLDAKISLFENDYVNATCAIQHALSDAEEVAMDKEWLACMLVQIKLIRESAIEGSDEFCIKNLHKCLDIAIKDKLLYRIQTIMQLSKEYSNTIYLLACEKYRELSKKLYKEESDILDFCISKMEPFIKNNYNDFIIEHKCVTPRLLLKSGFRKIDCSL